MLRLSARARLSRRSPLLARALSSKKKKRPVARTPAAAAAEASAAAAREERAARRAARRKAAPSYVELDETGATAAVEKKSVFSVMPRKMPTAASPKSFFMPATADSVRAQVAEARAKGAALPQGPRHEGPSSPEDRARTDREDAWRRRLRNVLLVAAVTAFTGAVYVYGRYASYMYDVARVDPPADSEVVARAEGCGGDAHQVYYATEWELPAGGGPAPPGGPGAVELPTLDMLVHGFVANVPSFLRGREQDLALRASDVPRYGAGHKVGDFRVVGRTGTEVVFGNGRGWFVVLRLQAVEQRADATVYEAGVGLVVRHHSELGARDRLWQVPLTETVNRFMMKQGVLYCRDRVGDAPASGFEFMNSFVNKPPPPPPSAEAVDEVHARI